MDLRLPGAALHHPDREDNGCAHDGDRFEQITVARKQVVGIAAPTGVITAAMAAVPDKARSEFAKGEAKLREKA